MLLQYLLSLSPKLKMILFTVICALAIIYFRERGITKIQSIMSIASRDEVLEMPTMKDEGKQSTKYYDVLLNGYMRSGSTLTGLVLGYREDTFYYYEPLWKIARWNYWRGNSTFCKLNKYDCRYVEPGSIYSDDTFYNNKGGLKGSLDMAMKLMRGLYNCQFGEFEGQTFSVRMSGQQGGPKWKKVMACGRKVSNKSKCWYKLIPEECQQASHRVAKTLRLGTDLLAPILEERKNLKAFHLFRDPRAIINSRMEVRFYPITIKDDAHVDAEALCDKMLYDFCEGKKLLEKYPDRFKFLFYEDINEEPFEKVKAMYRFAGMSLDEKWYPNVRNIQVFTPEQQKSLRENNTAYWWRMSLDWKTVQGMEDVCSDVYKEIGYRSFKSFDELRNLSISSVNFAKKYLLNIG